jgi:hypothetical protein
MHDLKIDDMVLVAKENAADSFSRVIGFFHRIEDTSANFIRIHFELSNETMNPSSLNNFITLTPKHLVLTGDQESNGFEYKPAESVQVGAQLKYFEEKSRRFLLVRVFKTELISLKNSGIYAPLTESGTLIVDNIHVSCFSVVRSHLLAQLFYSMLNLLNYYVFNVADSYHFFSSCSRFIYEIVKSLHIEQLFLNISV